MNRIVAVLLCKDGVSCLCNSKLLKGEMGRYCLALGEDSPSDKKGYLTIIKSKTL